MAKQDIIKHFRTSTPGRVPTPSELLEGELFINVFDAVVFMKDDSGIIRRFRGLESETFNITIPGTTSFPVLATATLVLSFTLNQLDYCEFVSITPPGSGIIIYDDVAASYVTEVGDFVKILYF